MSAYEEKTGGDVLAIAHNGNLSNGRMFPIIESFTGKRVDREYVEQSAKWEHLYEATADQGRQRERIRSSRRTMSSPTSSVGTKGNLDLTAAKKTGNAGIRIRPLRAQERPASWKTDSA
jgi:hypothetical protein